MRRFETSEPRYMVAHASASQNVAPPGHSPSHGSSPASGAMDEKETEEKTRFQAHLLEHGTRTRLGKDIDRTRFADHGRMPAQRGIPPSAMRKRRTYCGHAHIISERRIRAVPDNRRPPLARPSHPRRTRPARPRAFPRAPTPGRIRPTRRATTTQGSKRC